ncbi:hypothetical protein GIB67_010594 [Kingdonia uniflora]|uniref:Protein FAR1-RELATED SEQUENCE n=1 Tax=Kingdonia uniflora TaxID=39325 RepID=A0A7J7MB72_9MAGN|nr:hypothetical protein GIB67_010594 [Kingdonia uniflora]
MSKHKYCQVAPHQALLKDVAKIYTRIMFHKLEQQFDQVVLFITLEIFVQDNLCVFTVKSHSGHPESFELHIDLEKLTGQCRCKLFKYVELPCQYLLKVFLKYDILKILEAFIMTRWRIGTNKFSRSYDESHLSVENLRQPLRYSHLSLHASLLFDKASNTKENFEFMVLKLDEIESYLYHYDESLTVLDASEPAMISPLVESMMSETPILDPLVVQTKGRAKLDHKKGRRWMGGGCRKLLRRRREHAQEVGYLSTTTNEPAHFLRRRYLKQGELMRNKLNNCKTTTTTTSRERRRQRVD